jgi:putative DNA primase/helicase
MSKIDRYELVSACAGRWECIFQELAPEVAPAIDACYSPSGSPLRRPRKLRGNKNVCGYSSFRFLPKWLELGSAAYGGQILKNGIDVVMFVNGWSFIDSLKAIYNFINGSTVSLPVRATHVHKVDYSKNQTRIDNAIKFSKRDNKSLQLVRSYFLNRGIDIPLARIPTDLSLGWRHYYEAGEKLGEYWTVLAHFRNLENDLVSLHQTFLEDSFKAPVNDPKKFLSPAGDMNGCSIRFDQPDKEYLAIGEGIENTLVVREAFRKSGHSVPSWATASSSFMKTVMVPDNVLYVAIFADNDKNKTGITAALELAQRLESDGKIVSIYIPPLFDNLDSSDWLGYAQHLDHELVFNKQSLKQFLYQR